MTKRGDFSRRVIESLCQIPRGETISYEELAGRAGNPKAARAVGNILSKNKKLVLIPCHRVIKKNGALGGYVGGPAKKRQLLEQEGVRLRDVPACRQAGRSFGAAHQIF